MLVVGRLAHAKQCGDADGNGTVTVSDAVNVLRAAAELSSTCTPEVCDLNVDNVITVSDGVRALRMVAELETASCTLDVAAQVADRTRSILEIGVAVVGHQSAVRSDVTMPCPDGGSFDETDTTLTFVDCRDGDVVSNGVVDLSQVVGSADVRASFQSFRATRISTGETLLSSGSVVFSPRGDNLAVNGTIARSSTLIGDYTDAFVEVVADASRDPVALLSGTVTTTPSHAVSPSNGSPLTNVLTLQTNIAGPDLSIVVVTFIGGAQQVVIVAGDIGLCDPCTTNAQCNPELACLPCNSDCTPGAPRRCTVNFQNFAAHCSDGLF